MRRTVQIYKQGVGLVRAVIVILCLLTTLEATYKEHTTVITGSLHINRVGSIEAPEHFPHGAYLMDHTAYIFIFENVAQHGSVQVEVDIFDLHPNSWITVRRSKYGGYLGRVVARYNSSAPMPRILLTDTCCLRIEFQTSCCGSATGGVQGVREFTGFRAFYKFVPTLYKGRQSECYDRRRPSLCNGECLPAGLDCPCSKYGQYKCGNSMCIPQEQVCDGQDDCGDTSDENGCKKITPRTGVIEMFGMYALEPILMTLGGTVLVSFTIVCILCSLDTKLTRQLCQVIHRNTAEQDKLSQENAKLRKVKVEAAHISTDDPG